MSGGLFGDNDSSTNIPGYLKEAGKDITRRAGNIADTPYTPYSAPRFAPQAANTQFASNYASGVAGLGQGKVDQATDLYGQSARSIPDMDVSRYMNPYIEQVLNPQAQKIEEAYGKMTQQAGDEFQRAGAYGGSRHGVREAEVSDDKIENLMELYGTGYGRAFDQATNLMTGEFGRQAGAAGGLLGAAGQESQLVSEDVNRLLGTGAAQQAYAQQQPDFDYGQFLEGRDWPTTQLMPYISAVGGIPYSTKTQGPSTSPFAQIAGAGLSAASLMSDEGSKENITAADPFDGEALEMLNDLDLFDYNYKPEVQAMIGDDGSRRRGPMAQDYAEVFGLDDDKVIPFPHAMGLMMSAIQELSAEVNALAA